MTRWAAGIAAYLLVLAWAGAAAAEIDEDAILCISCHVDVDDSHVELIDEWRRSVHYEQGVTCGMCHQMSDTDFDALPEPGEGKHTVPDTARTLRMCTQCHSEWLEYYPLSAHFQIERLSCVMCHNGGGSNHAIQRASLDIINEARCSKCHTYDRAAEAKAEIADAERAYTHLEEMLQTISAEGYHSVRLEGLHERAEAMEKRLPLQLHTFQLRHIKSASRGIEEIEERVVHEQERILAKLATERRRQRIGVLILVSAPLLSMLILAFRQTYIDEWRAKYGPPPEQ